MQEQLIFWFDLVGTVIFAVTGAVSGVKMRLDLLGVVVFGCTVGVGGGIVRDVVIGAVPAAVLQNETYLMLCIVTGLLIFAFSSRIINHRRIILLCDAYGLGVFTALGAAKGAQQGLGIIGVSLCGVLSAVGGGILRDVMSKRVPAILTNDFYATASLIGGVMYYYLIEFQVPYFSAILIVAGTVIVIRLLAIRLNLQLPSSRLAAGVKARRRRKGLPQA